MAARTKTDIVNEARGIAKRFGISVQLGEHAGDAQGEQDFTTMTFEQAMLRLQLLQVELLTNIRNGES